MKRKVVKVETTLDGHGRVLLDDGSELHAVLGVDAEVRPGCMAVLVLRMPLVPIEMTEPRGFDPT